VFVLLHTIQEILACTMEWHPDHEPLTAALEKIKLVAQQVDVQEKKNQAHNRIMEINESLIGMAGMVPDFPLFIWNDVAM
jgi:hypothetical protein